MLILAVSLPSNNHPTLTQLRAVTPAGKARSGRLRKKDWVSCPFKLQYLLRHWQHGQSFGRAYSFVRWNGEDLKQVRLFICEINIHYAWEMNELPSKDELSDLSAHWTFDDDKEWLAAVKKELNIEVVIG